MSFLLGFIFSLIVSIIAYRKKSLSKSGMLGASLIGTVYFGFGDLAWYGILLAFFISSSFLSHYHQHEKRKWEEGFEKSGQRDFGQTMANGAIGGIIILCAFFYPEWQSILYVGFLGVMASVTADTWATEVGILSKRPPRHILTGQYVEPGRSGGVTLIGTLTGGVGAFFIGGSGILLSVLTDSVYIDKPFIILLTITVSGMFGSLMDSIIGAKWQRMNRCPKCMRWVEKDVHCGVETIYQQGIRWLRNDWVNALSSLMGGVLAVLLFTILT